MTFSVPPCMVTARPAIRPAAFRAPLLSRLTTAPERMFKPLPAVVLIRLRLPAEPRTLTVPASTRRSPVKVFVAVRLKAPDPR